MSGYRKEVRIHDTGMVAASVWSPDGRRVGLRFASATDWWRAFGHDPDRIEKAARKAHKWADDLIDVCERLECSHDP